MDQELTKLGLTDTEAKIYLAILGLGPSAASNIAKQANIKRTTAYSALEHLVRLGLISEVADSKEKMFKSEDPEKLQKLTKKMRRQVIEAEIKLEELLPGLKAIQKKIIEAPKVVFYQGLNGIKNILEDFTASAEPWYFFGASEGIISNMSREDFAEINEDTDKIREKAGRPMVKFITDKGILELKNFKMPKPGIREIRILPHLIKSKSALVLYENKLVMISFANPSFGATFESREVVELVKIMFNIIWEGLAEAA